MAEKVVLVSSLAAVLAVGESVRCDDGGLGKIVGVTSFGALTAASQRTMLKRVRVGAATDVIELQVYEASSVSHGRSRVDLTDSRVFVLASEIKAVVLVVHERELSSGAVGIPLEGIVDAFVIDRVGKKRVPIEKWRAMPDSFKTRTAKALGWRVELRRVAFGLLSENVYVTDKDGIGYSASTLSIDDDDWKVIEDLFSATDAPPTRRSCSGSKFPWTVRAADVMFTKQGVTTVSRTLTWQSPAQLRSVSQVLGALWNVGVKQQLLDSKERQEVGLEDPLRPGDAGRCSSWTLHAVVPPEVEVEAGAGTSDSESESSSDECDDPAEPDEPASETSQTRATRASRKRRFEEPVASSAAAEPQRPSQAVVSWIGQYFDDDGECRGVWRVEDVSYDDTSKQFVVWSERVQPPPPSDPDKKSEDDSWWNWSDIPRFRNSFASKLRLRAKKGARSPRTPRLCLTYVSRASGRGDLRVGVYWQAKSVAALGGRSLAKLLA